MPLIDSVQRKEISGKEIMLSNRRRWWALALAATLLSPAAFADGTITWDWSAQEHASGAVVAQDSGSLLTTPAVNSITLDEPRAFVAGVGPLTTSFEFQVDGHIDIPTRSVGVGVEIVAEESPWDERSPPPVSTRRLGKAAVRAELRDVVDVLSVSGMLAALGEANFVTGALRPSKFDGSLFTPAIVAGEGASLSEIQLEFGVYEILANDTLDEKFSKSFIKTITSEHGGEMVQFNNSLHPAEGDPLGSSRIPLQNGRSHLIVITMQAVVELTGTPFPANDPARLSANSSFNNTFSFGGLFDFRDANGNALNDVTFTSQGGIDWLSPLTVPLPGSLSLLLGGVALLAGAMRRARY
ncbi:MAG: hypothetical protein IPM80_03260 [Proteobacteria bacterium]|nr:hypothetical protein [Pseudomonadota bacterium]